MRLDLYVVTDERIARGRSHHEVARRAVEGGADAVQLRDKEMGGRRLLQAAHEVREATAGALFIVNDRLDIALASGADGVHLGQDDLPVPAARRLCPQWFIIGASVGTVEEGVQAAKDGADYVALSPVFDTASKGDAGPGRGLQTLRDLRSAVRVPIVGIGGITVRNVGEVIAAGADGAAVISAVVAQGDIAAAARGLRSAIAAAKGQRGR